MVCIGLSHLPVEIYSYSQLIKLKFKSRIPQEEEKACEYEKLTCF